MTPVIQACELLQGRLQFETDIKRLLDEVCTELTIAQFMHYIEFYSPDIDF
jgi:hypothetical protein